ncbi:MAG: Gfo/Idh/MocA family oxidoreductase [Proteobacteria bacterium]|nr:Gfo/Idh/MocA family oxidoreductase [Pseudomonadota bacterium]
MKALVIGTGSIGRRHIANLLKLGVEVSAFSYRDTDLPPIPNGSVVRVSSWQEAIKEDFDFVVVANSTDNHMDVALRAARAGRNLFLEKPVGISLAGVEELTELIHNKGLIVEVGYMMRSHPNLVWMREQLAANVIGDILYVRASVGQWLPDWRPGTDYRTGYGAFRAKGGGVVFDLIHEIDLVCWLFGSVADVTAMLRHAPQLEIETESVAQIGLTMDTGILAQIHLDYVRPLYGRSLEIVGEKGVLSWDYTQGTVQIDRAAAPRETVHKLPEGFERNIMFLTHMKHLLKRIETPAIPSVASYQDGVDSLRVALAAHRAARERRHIRPLEIDTMWSV